MTKLKRTADGGYIIKGKKYETLRGSRRQVHEYETAYKTAGGLLKEDLVQNNKGRIVSKAKFDDGSNLLKNLTRRGFFTKKGKFGHTKMKTRKLRKKLTRKNRRKMKGGESIQGIKEKLKLAKNMIPNQIEKIKTSPEFKAALSIDQTGTAKNMIDDKIFKPLKDINNQIQEPITQVETTIDTIETKAKKGLEDGKKTLKGEVTKQFDKIDNLINNGFGEIKKQIPGSSMPGFDSLTPAGAALYTAKTGIKKVISSKKEEILTQIDAIDFDKLVEGATSVAATAATSKSPSPSSNKPPVTNKENTDDNKNTDDKNETPDDKNETPDDKNETPDDNNETLNDVEDNLTPEQAAKHEENMINAKHASLKSLVDGDKAAELAAEQIENMGAVVGPGGKKKSKGKK